MAQKRDVDIEQGDSWDRTLEFTKSDGTAQDISGWTIYTAIKDEREDTSPALSKTVTSHTNASGGVTEIGFTSSETQSLEARTYYYDIRFRTDQDKVDTLVEGVFKVDTPVSDVS